MKRIVGGIGLALLMGALLARAEMRTWTSIKGDAIEAEYVKVHGSNVILKTSEGRVLRVPVDGLCVGDKKYLARIIPPEINIEVNVDVDNNAEYSGSNYARKTESIKCSIELTKTNKEPSDCELTVRIYVFAKKERADLRWLISHEEHSINFMAGKVVQFRTSPASVQHIKSGYSNDQGFRYEGYLVLIEDDKGRVLAMESNKEKYEKNRNKLKSAKKGAQFDRDFDLMDEKRRSSWSTFSSY